MPHQCWTIDELNAELSRFKSELQAAGKSQDTVHTYVDRSGRFIRWLVGDYRP